MNEEIRGAIVIALIHKQDLIRNLVSEFIKQRKEALDNPDNKLFKDDIDKQFKDVVKSTVAEHLTMHLGCSTEDVYIVLDDLNFKEYFGYEA